MNDTQKIGPDWKPDFQRASATARHIQRQLEIDGNIGCTPAELAELAMCRIHQIDPRSTEQTVYAVRARFSKEE